MSPEGAMSAGREIHVVAVVHHAQHILYSMKGKTFVVEKKQKYMTQSRNLLPHCYLFSMLMYLLRVARNETLTAWWYLLSCC